MLTGELPFRGVYEMLLHQIRHNEPPRPRSLNAKIPRDLEIITLKCLEKEPSRRYPSAHALAEDLARWLDGRVIVARPVGRVERGWRWVKRHPVPVGLSVALAASLLTGIAMTTTYAIRASASASEARDNALVARQNEGIAEQQRAQAQALREVAEGNASKEALARQAAEASERLARRNMYFAQISAAQQAWSEGSLGRVLTLLNDIRPRPGEPDPRGFEYYFLWRLCHENVETTRPGVGILAGCSISPDGQTVAIAGFEGDCLILWELATGRRKPIQGIGPGCYSTLFAPDGNTVVVTTFEGVAFVDAKSASLKAKLSLGSDVRYALALSLDAKYLAVGDHYRGIVHLFEMETMRRREDLSAMHSDLTGTLWTLAFVPGTHQIIMGGGPAFGYGQMQLWNVEEKRSIYRVRGHMACVTSLVVAPDGKTFYSGAGDRRIKLWQVATGAELSTLGEHDGTVTSLCLSSDGQRLVSGSSDRTVRIWDPAKGTLADTIKAHEGVVSGVALTPGGESIISVSADGHAKRWPVRVRTAFESLEAPRKPRATLLGLVGTMALSKETLGLFDLVLDAAFSPDDRFLAQCNASITSGGLCRLWDVETKRVCHEIETTIGGALFTAVAFTPDGKSMLLTECSLTALLGLAANGSLGGTSKIMLVDIESGNRRIIYDSSQSEEPGLLELDVAMSPDGRHFATIAANGIGRLWQLDADGAAKAPRTLVSSEGSWGTTVAFAPDGKRLACGLDERVFLFDIPTGERAPLEIPAEEDAVYALDFSADGQMLAVGGGNRTERLESSGFVALYDLRADRATLLTRYQGHATVVRSVSFSPSGQRVFSMSVDGLGRIWDRETGYELLSLDAGGLFCAGACQSTSGLLIAAGDERGRLRLWRASQNPESQLRGFRSRGRGI